MARPANVAYISAVREYARKRPLYRDFERRLRVLLINLLDNGKVDYSAVQSRTKGISSFALKIQRKNYANPLKDTVDLCGLRVIVYYLSELGRVTDIIENEFVVDRRNTVDKTTVVGPEQFGYSSIHYVIGLTPQRLSLPEWQEFRGLKAEIQIRTMPQHVWASISHRLQYKKESEIPDSLRHKLHRIAAQLEQVDEEFQVVRDDVKRLVEDYPKTTITSWALVSYFRNSPIAMELEREGSQAGFVVNVDDSRLSTELVEACSRLSMTSLADLDKFLAAISGKRRNFMQGVRDHASGRSWRAAPLTIALTLLYACYPSKFNQTYLKRFGWRLRAIETIQQAASDSGIKPPRR